MPKGWKKRVVTLWRGWGYSIFIALLVATSFKSAIADWNDVPTGSMIPTILIGDRIFVNKLAYDLKVPYTTWHLKTWSAPQRGDIVVFYSPEDGKRLVKRVVGIPGDTLAMLKNRLIINGQFLTYLVQDQNKSPLKDDDIRDRHLFYDENLMGKQHEVMFTPAYAFSHSFAPVKIPQGKYFMMGDNRDNSADSRFFGLVDRNVIVGQATAVVISRNKNFLHPRWQRFFTKLL